MENYADYFLLIGKSLGLKVEPKLKGTLFVATGKLCILVTFAHVENERSEIEKIVQLLNQLCAYFIFVCVVSQFADFKELVDWQRVK